MLRCVRRDRCYSSCTSSSSQQNDKTYEAVKTENMDASTMSSSPSSTSSSRWSDMFERNTPVLIKGQSATNRDGYLTCQRQYYIRISSFIRDGYYFKYFFFSLPIRHCMSSRAGSCVAGVEQRGVSSCIASCSHFRVAFFFYYYRPPLSPPSSCHQHHIILLSHTCLLRICPLSRIGVRVASGERRGVQVGERQEIRGGGQGVLRARGNR